MCSAWFRSTIQPITESSRSPSSRAGRGSPRRPGRNRPVLTARTVVRSTEMLRSARCIRLAAIGVALVGSFAASAAAQDENALKAYFEGRRILLRMDMPGSADGVDVQLDPARGIDYKKYRENLKRYGIAIGSGDS